MNMYDIITKKKRGEELTEGEIRNFVFGYTEGTVPDYQVSALLMAICLRGMTDRETVALTEAISNSGEVLDLSEFGNLTADKHSTGGVGDKTTLIVAPIAAALGCKVAKMSGRGLGHTGGTIDKLESVSGYKINLSPDEFTRQVKEIGIAVVGQTKNLAPADKKLYALRDVTGTVDSIPLITSSIMGKKLASGSKSIVLDVKCGSGAFVKTLADAELLGRSMVNIGELSKRRVSAVITDMDTPLGFAVGNILEVKEAIETLLGNGPRDLAEICTTLAASMAHLALDISLDEAKRQARHLLDTGMAYEKFKAWIEAQGGDVRLIENPELFPTAEIEYTLTAKNDGYIAKMDAEKIGLSAMKLGAGRETKDAEIDYTAGIRLMKKTGDYVKCGDTLAYFYTNNESAISDAEELFFSSITYSDTKPEMAPLIYKIITDGA